MHILAINTATDALSVGVSEDGQPLAELLLAALPKRSAHSERLMPAIDLVMKLAALAPADLGGVAVLAGPGGFTGIRTGLAVAKAVAQARGIPAWGVDTLEALAESFPGEGWIAPMLDARRGDVFAALYRRVLGRLTLERGPELVTLDSWVSGLADRPVTFFGEGAERHPELVPPILPAEAHFVRPAAIARLALPHLAAGGEDVAGLVPRYHRVPAMAKDWTPLAP